MKKPWYEEFFESGDYYRMYSAGSLLRFPESTAQQVDFIVDVLGLERGARILDLACGHGRISVPLAQRGYDVTGVDLSGYHLRLAKKAAKEAQAFVSWVRSDMRRIKFESEFEAVVNVFTSFGYFEDEREDQRVLEAVAGALKPGGRLLLDTMNREWLIRNFSPNSWEEHEDGLITMERRKLELEESRVVTDFAYIEPGGRRVCHTVSLRLYALHELKRLLAVAGLHMEKAWGGFDKREYGIDGRRLILMAIKS